MHTFCNVTRDRRLSGCIRLFHLSFSHYSHSTLSPSLPHSHVSPSLPHSHVSLSPLQMRSISVNDLHSVRLSWWSPACNDLHDHLFPFTIYFDQSVYLSIYPFMLSNFYQSIHLFTFHLPIYKSIYLSIFLSIYISIYTFICLYIHLVYLDLRNENATFCLIVVADVDEPAALGLQARGQRVPLP